MTINNQRGQIYKRATRADVARLAGVSVATVSYVVNGTSNPVAEKTRLRVLEAVKQLNYTPHAIARSLKTGSSGMIGLIIPVLTSTGMTFTASTVQDALISKGFMVIMANSHEDNETEKKMVSALLAQSVDGIIISPASRFNKKMLEPVIQSGIPLVFMDRFVKGLHVDTVVSNNVKAGRDGTDYLIKCGCRRIVCLCFNCEASSAYERVKGYKEALKAAGIGVDEDAILTIKERFEVQPIFAAYLEKFGVPEGILCTTEELGIELLTMVMQRNIPISNRHIAVFDAEWGMLPTPAIPVVRQNFVKMAQTAANLMIARLKGDQSDPQVIQIDAELLIPKE